MEEKPSDWMGNAQTEALAGGQDVDRMPRKGIVKEVPHLLRFSRVEDGGRVLGGSETLSGDGNVKMLAAMWLTSHSSSASSLLASIPAPL